MSLLKSEKLGIAVIAVISIIVTHYLPEVDEGELVNALTILFSVLIGGQTVIEGLREWKGKE